MQRNKSSNFSLLPSAHIQRSTFDRSSSHKFTFNVGDVVPFYVDEVLPGDTFQIKTSKLVRLQTPVTPFMDNLYLDTYYFFVPNRLVWNHWKEFQGENNSSSWIPTTEYHVPQITLPEPSVDAYTGLTDVSLGDHSLFAIGSIADYMGLPAANCFKDNKLNPIAYFNTFSVDAPKFNALPLRAYALICNDWFRDQNLSDPLHIPLGDSDTAGMYDSPYVPVDLLYDNLNPLERCVRGGRPFKAAKYHDYFTSALPSPLKGDEVKVPVTNMNTGSDVNEVTMLDSSGTTYYIQRNSSGALVTSTSSGANDLFYGDAFLTGYNAGISINDLRLAFATQAQYERDARGGTRYTEMLRSNFGVVSPDASLQRSQYLGGNHFSLNVNQVVQSAGGLGTDFLGDTGAFSATPDSHGDFIQSFTEHGFIIGVCVARYDHSYQEGVSRFWNRKQRFDYYMPSFANIGEQSILNQEIYLDTKNDGTNNYTENSKNPKDVFGYQEAWSEYRMKENRVSGEMRSSAYNSLDFWHLADYYGYDNAPSLSDAWIREDPSIVDRVLSVDHNTSMQIFADFYIDNKTTRPIPMYSIPATLGGNL